MNGRKFLVVVLILGAAALAFWLFRSRSGADSDASAGRAASSPEKQGGAPLPVYVARVQPRLLQERVMATGSVAADESVELASEIAGRVTALNFEEGARVRQGDVLVKIEDAELVAQLNRAESRVALARAQAERQRVLVRAGGTSQADLDAAESEVLVLEAEAKLARALLAKTELRAPFDGVIGLRYVSIGANLTAGTRIATLQKLDSLKVEFSLAERHLGRIQPDGEVRVTVAGITESFTGRIYAQEPRIDPETRTLRLRARAANPGNRVLAGGFATVEVPLQAIPDALMVPADALITGLNEQQVYVLENGRAQPRRVQTGLRLAREVQITSGLEAGAVVITSGQLQLRPGAAVEAVTRQERESSAATTAP